jgi:hypothetical protein
VHRYISTRYPNLSRQLLLPPKPTFHIENAVRYDWNPEECGDVTVHRLFQLRYVRGDFDLVHKCVSHLDLKNVDFLNLLNRGSELWTAIARHRPSLLHEYACEDIQNKIDLISIIASVRGHGWGYQNEPHCLIIGKNHQSIELINRLFQLILSCPKSTMTTPIVT